MNRRSFVKSGCLACAALGTGIMSSALASCGSALPVLKLAPREGRIEVDPSNFMTDMNLLRIRSSQLEHDILLVRQSADRYKALILQCTHNQVDLAANQNKIFCTSHGAEFDFTGKVLKGPAEKNLITFPVTVENGKIFVKIART